jgi:hypothetical protein
VRVLTQEIVGETNIEGFDSCGVASEADTQYDLHSISCISESVSLIESALMFSCRCSTLRPPTMGNTNGVLRMT